MKATRAAAKQAHSLEELCAKVDLVLEKLGIDYVEPERALPIEPTEFRVSSEEQKAIEAEAEMLAEAVDVEPDDDTDPEVIGSEGVTQKKGKRAK